MNKNPWETASSFINVGGLNNILAVHKRFSSSNRYGMKKQCSSSVDYIDMLRQLSNLSAEQAKVNVDLQTQKLYDDFYNILHADVLDGLLSMTDFLSKHLQYIIENKEKLITHLHQPFVGEHIIVNAQYHRDVSEFFPKVSAHLANLSTILSSFEWIHKYSIKNSNLAAVLEFVMSALATLQKQYQAMSETRDLMNSMTERITRT